MTRSSHNRNETLKVLKYTSSRLKKKESGLKIQLFSKTFSHFGLSCGRVKFERMIKR